MIYQKAIRLINNPGLTECELEHDFHHFRVRWQHDKQRISKLEGDSIRFPWTTCGAEAASQLPQLQNLRFGSFYSQLSNEHRFQQCTHLFDMLHYAAVHATRDLG